MNSECWKILGIEPTDNKAEIKKAFAAQLKLNPPGKDPEKYQKIRQAYDQALKSTSFENSMQEEPVEPSADECVKTQAFKTELTDEKPCVKNKSKDGEAFLNEEEDALGDEKAKKIHTIRDDFLNADSAASIRHEAIKKERGHFMVLAVLFVPVSMIILFVSQKNHGGIMNLVFNLLCGFVIAALSTKIERMLNCRVEKKELEKVSLGDVNAAANTVTVLLVLRLFLTLALCLLLKIVLIAAKCPDYMQHYFGGILFFYFVYNLSYLKKQLRKKF